MGGGLNRFYGIPALPSASVMAQDIQLFGPREGFLTHQWIITGNKYITDKYYDEKMPCMLRHTVYSEY